MEFSVGDIIFFRSDVAGKAKYHFCFYFDDTSDRFGLIFLNSEGIYTDHFAVDCAKIPELPQSRTGQSIFSCPTVIRRSPEQLLKLNPEKKCTLSKEVASEFLAFAHTITSMTVRDKERLIATLSALAA